jgi:hypothetical protein
MPTRLALGVAKDFYTTDSGTQPGLGDGLHGV